MKKMHPSVRASILAIESIVLTIKARGYCTKADAVYMKEISAELIKIIEKRTGK